MKKRLLCLVLCAVMLLSVFLTGCKKEEGDDTTEIEKTNSATAVTLTMWVVSEKEVDPATASAVNAALNSITKTRFKTQLIVNFLTEAQYQTVLGDTIRANEDSRNVLDPSYVPPTENKAPVVTAEGETIAEETDTNEYGFVVTKYPALRPNQVDIIYINGELMYKDYINNGWLTALDSELSAASKKIKEYISQTLLNAAKVDGSTYAIPNNSTIGEYTYMLLDKELMDECFMNGVYQQGKINGFFNDYIFNYLETVRKYHTDVTPVAAGYNDCLNLLAHYWSIDPNTYDAQENTFSFLGYRYTDVASLSQGKTVLSFDSLFADDVFNENFIKLNEFKYDGGYFDENAEFAADKPLDKKVAIQFVTGDLSKYEEYSENYYPVIVKYPSVDVEMVYENMFGVYTNSVDAARSMEIITYLNTNVDFRNILQYGIEGVHYEVVDEDGTKIAKPLTEDYVMDVFKTGNAFITYPLYNEAKVGYDVWEIGKQQNRQALVEPLLNFDFQQIAKDSYSVSTTNPQIGAAGYTYSFTTGYSREVLAQNELLKKWMDACDAAGAGVYVKHTNSISGQNVTGKIYYYNNNISNATVQVSDADGTVKVDYTGTAGSGNEITVISFYGRKNSSKLNWAAAVNGADVATTVSYQNALLNFDIYNTEHYAIDYRSGLTKSMVAANNAVWKWILASKTGTDPFVVKYAKTIGEGENAQTMYTYLFYINSITNKYDFTVMPTMSGTVLNLDIQYIQSAAALSEGAAKYALFAMTVYADEEISDVKFNLTVNGNSSATVNESEFAADPEFALCGELDTEMVHYFYRFNKQIEAWLKVCEDAKSVDQLRTLIADLKVLLTVPEKQPFPYASDILADLTEGGLVAQYVDSNSFDSEDFFWYLYAATSQKEVIHQFENDDMELEEVKNDPTCGEIYHYFSSPYMLYYAWLKDNGFAK